MKQANTSEANPVKTLHQLKANDMNQLGTISLENFSIVIKKKFHSHPVADNVIFTKCCTWHNNCMVMWCININCGMIASNGITAKQKHSIEFELHMKIF